MANPYKREKRSAGYINRDHLDKYGQIIFVPEQVKDNPEFGAIVEAKVIQVLDGDYKPGQDVQHMENYTYNGAWNLKEDYTAAVKQISNNEILAGDSVDCSENEKAWIAAMEECFGKQVYNAELNKMVNDASNSLLIGVPFKLTLTKAFKKEAIVDGKKVRAEKVGFPRIRVELALPEELTEETIAKYGDMLPNQYTGAAVLHQPSGTPTTTMAEVNPRIAEVQKEIASLEAQAAAMGDMDPNLIPTYGPLKAELASLV